MSLYGFPCLNPIVIPLVTTSVKTYTSSYCLFFFLISSILTRIPSVYINDIFLLVNTERVSDEKNSVGKDHHKIPTEKICR